MSERSDALKLAEEFQALHRTSGHKIEIAVRAIAMQAVIFERLNPELWEIAMTDAREGLSLALPETEN